MPKLTEEELDAAHEMVSSNVAELTLWFARNDIPPPIASVIADVFIYLNSNTTEIGGQTVTLTVEQIHAYADRKIKEVLGDDEDVKDVRLQPS